MIYKHHYFGVKKTNYTLDDLKNFTLDDPALSEHDRLIRIQEYETSRNTHASEFQVCWIAYKFIYENVSETIPPYGST